MEIEVHQSRIIREALNTGAYAYPLDEAADVTIATTCEFLAEHTIPRLVRFVLWGDAAMRAFERAMERWR